MSELTRRDFRAIIFYNFKRGLSADDFVSELKFVLNEKAPSHSSVYRWYKQFQRGDLNFSDDSRSGRPVEAVTSENVAAVTDSWLYYYDVKSKSKNKAWVFEEEEQPTTVKQSRSVKKKMVVVFFGKRGIIKRITLDEQKTVTAKCPDRAPCDFGLFPMIKNKLKGHRYSNDEQLIRAWDLACEEVSEETWKKIFVDWFRREIPIKVKIKNKSKAVAPYKRILESAPGNLYMILYETFQDNPNEL
nr:uncharacterized protein LOC113400850 [Vanessa tameamea]